MGRYDKWTGKPIPYTQSLLPKPNGLRCDTCGTECIDRCPVCGAPQCCPKCCKEATKERKYVMEEKCVRCGEPVYPGSPVSFCSTYCEAVYWRDLSIEGLEYELALEINARLDAENGEGLAISNSFDGVQLLEETRDYLELCVSYPGQFSEGMCKAYAEKITSHLSRLGNKTPSRC